MNAARQEYVRAIHGTIAGATTAPTLVPALKIPVARARSFFGNHSATVLMEAGKLPASPSPSANRTTMNPITDTDKANVHGAAPKTALTALKPATTVFTTGATIGAE